MTSPGNFVDPTGHYFAKIDIAGHYNSGSSVVVVPEPESRPDTTTGSSTGSGGSGTGSGSSTSLGSTTSNDEGVIVPSLTDLYYIVPELNKDDSIDYMLQRPPRNFGDTGVYYIDYNFSVGPSYAGMAGGFTGGYLYVINTNEGWVAECAHVGPYLGFSASPVPASVQYTTGVVYGDMTDPNNYEGFFWESSFSIVGSYASAVSFLGKKGYGAVSQQGSGAETNVAASAGANFYWLTNLIYIDGD